MASKLERDAVQWIEDVTGESLGASFAEALKDGVILCKLANAIKPGSVAKVNAPATMPFKKMENIANFLKAVRALGMKEFEMFSTPDLFDEKNVPQVVNSIHALGRLLQTIMPDSKLPKLGIKVVEKNERVFSEDQLRHARGAVSVLNLGSSDLAKKAATDLLEGRAAMADVHANLGKPKPPPPSGPSPRKAGVAPPSEPKAAPASGAGATPALPSGWEAMKDDESGDVYYYHAESDKTQWERPLDAAAAAAPLPAGWEAVTDPDSGDVYYYHEARDETTWERPTA